jgi:hypothetical protein
MKGRIVAAALLMMVLFAGVSNSASARGWGRGGFYGPRVGVRIFAPVPPMVFPAPVVVGGYYGGGYGYGGGGYPYYGGGYYGHGGYYGRGGGYYDRGGYRGGQGRGGYARGGGHYGPRGRR